MAGFWPKKRLPKALLFAIGSGLITTLWVLSPSGQQAEERFGLDWLFQLRGPLNAPGDVVIVAIDKSASDELGVPYDTTRWPRGLHTRLLEGLTAAGARVVTFDLLFRQPREAEDEALTRAMNEAGNVALLEFLAKDQPGMVSHADREIPVTLQRRLLPAPKLAAAAAGSGPFTLSKVPDRVSQFWTFDQNAGSAASLPLVALLLYAEPEYQRLSARTGEQTTASPAPGLLGLVSRQAPAEAAAALASLLRQAPELTSPNDSLPMRTGSLDAVLNVLHSSLSRYINFYGPPQTVETISYARALQMLATQEGRDRFAGKAVFVGVSSPVQWHLQDHFRTVYSDSLSGLDLSGTEILATGFANLRDQTSIRPLDTAGVALTVILWGLLIGMIAWLLRPLHAMLLTAVLAAAYLYAAVHLFTVQLTWIPLFTPLVLQAPLMLFAATLWQHRQARADLSRIRDTFGHYLPQATVDRLVQEGFHPLEDRRTVFGVCLMTDAQGYTAIAEKMPSNQLVDLINDYLEVLIRPIRDHGGEVSDIKGDSVLAFWASRQDDLAIRTAACRALTDIQQAVEAWNDSNTHGARLPTRIGLHCGAMTLASVGAADHFEQRAVGDIVNTASRLEQLSKELGTRLLVSEQTIAGVDDVVTRYLGSFVLKGRTQPVRVHEVLGWGDEAREDWSVGVQGFFGRCRGRSNIGIGRPRTR